MAKLRPWYQVVTPREDLRENRPLDASEFAVHLDHIRDNRAHADYVKPERFFERTFMTKSLLDLSSQVVRTTLGHQGRDVRRLQHGHAVRRREDPLAHGPLSIWPEAGARPAPGEGSIRSSRGPR